MWIEFHPEAETEFIESALFYESRVAGLGYRFIHEIAYHTNLLLTHHELGEVYQGRLRQLVLAHFPYTLIYTIKPECIRIIAVSHQNKRPGFWNNRT